MDRSSINTVITNEAVAIDAGGNLTVSAAFVIFIRRLSDDKYWTGSVWQATKASIAMTEVDETNLPGVWRHQFDTDAVAEPLHNESDTYFFEMSDTSGISLYPRQLRSVIVSTELDRILGLNKENVYVDQASYTGGKLTTARKRIYSVAGSVGTDINVLATYNMTFTYTNDELETYKEVKA